MEKTKFNHRVFHLRKDKVRNCLLIAVAFLLLCSIESKGESHCQNCCSSPSKEKIGSPDLSKPLVKWTLNSSDTKICMGVGTDQKLYIYELRSPSLGWNWTKTPSIFPFVKRIDVDGIQYTPNWVYQNSKIEKRDGTELTIVFKNENPSLELKSVWKAHKGPGPIHHSMFIKNNSGKMITIYGQESFDLHIVNPGKDSKVVYVNDDRGLPDETGVYQVPLTDTYANTLPISENQDWIPFLGVETQKNGGMYLGWEWSNGRMAIKAEGAGEANIKVGNRDDFKTDLYAGETFVVPPGFIGTYAGDLDDAGNSLRKYLFNYSIPSFLRKDPGYPKLEWNAFAATGKNLGGWDPVEKKYYPLIDDITPLGFEEVVVDIGWWSSYGKPKPGHIVTDSIDWPSGMEAAAKYAHDRGLRFGLYDNQPELLTSEGGKRDRIAEISYLINSLKADFYRSDMTAGPVINGTFGKDQRAHYPEDVDYWATAGLYEVIKSMYKKD
ncbi:MAG: alpha-galactosidase, partial [Bacteroidota bacterium]|nr:alpha-galactosidase [Bacteroidota bacterium]